MSRNYDNWEKLVEAVLRREKDRQLALFESVTSSVFSSRPSFDSDVSAGYPHTDICFSGGKYPLVSRNYDNWEKLVGAVLRREKDRQLAFCESFSTISSRFSSFSFNSLDEDEDEDVAEVSRNSGQRFGPANRSRPKTSIFCDELVIDYEEIKKATEIYQSYMVKGEREILTSVYSGWIHEHHVTSVYKGSGIAVTIEMMNYEGSQGDEEWMDEINIFSQLRHPNFVKLIGYSFDTDNRILVYELMPRANLETHLFTKGWHRSLHWATRIKVAKGVAGALAFLHDLETPIIHRDVKSGTILLDDDFNAKLSNFSLALVCPESDVATEVVGTYGYAAPEYIATGHVTTRCDVYSFGVVLVELISGRRAVDGDQQMEMRNLIDWARPYLGAKNKLWRIMDRGLEGEYPHKEDQD